MKTTVIFALLLSGMAKADLARDSKILIKTGLISKADFHHNIDIYLDATKNVVDLADKTNFNNKKIIVASQAAWALEQFDLQFSYVSYLAPVYESAEELASLRASFEYAKTAAENEEYAEVKKVAKEVVTKLNKIKSANL